MADESISEKVTTENTLSGEISVQKPISEINDGRFRDKKLTGGGSRTIKAETDKAVEECEEMSTQQDICLENNTEKDMALENNYKQKATENELALESNGTCHKSLEIQANSKSIESDLSLQEGDSKGKSLKVSQSDSPEKEPSSNNYESNNTDDHEYKDQEHTSSIVTCKSKSIKRKLSQYESYDLPRNVNYDNTDLGKELPQGEQMGKEKGEKEMRLVDEKFNKSKIVLKDLDSKQTKSDSLLEICGVNPQISDVCQESSKNGDEKGREPLDKTGSLEGIDKKAACGVEAGLLLSTDSQAITQDYKISNKNEDKMSDDDEGDMSDDDINNDKQLSNDDTDSDKESSDENVGHDKDEMFGDDVENNKDDEMSADDDGGHGDDVDSEGDRENFGSVDDDMMDFEVFVESDQELDEAAHPIPVNIIKVAQGDDLFNIDREDESMSEEDKSMSEDEEIPAEIVSMPFPLQLIKVIPSAREGTNNVTSDGENETGDDSKDEHETDSEMCDEIESDASEIAQVSNKSDIVQVSNKDATKSKVAQISNEDGSKKVQGSDNDGSKSEIQGCDEDETERVQASDKDQAKIVQVSRKDGNAAYFKVFSSSNISVHSGSKGEATTNDTAETSMDANEENDEEKNTFKNTKVKDDTKDESQEENDTEPPLKKLKSSEQDGNSKDTVKVDDLKELESKDKKEIPKSMGESVLIFNGMNINDSARDLLRDFRRLSLVFLNQLYAVRDILKSNKELIDSMKIIIRNLPQYILKTESKQTRSTKTECHVELLREYVLVQPAKKIHSLWETMSLLFTGNAFSLDQCFRLLAFATLAKHSKYFVELMDEEDQPSYMSTMKKICSTEKMHIEDCWLPLQAMSISLQRPIYIYEADEDSLQNQASACDDGIYFEPSEELKTELYAANSPICGFLYKAWFSALVPKKANPQIFPPKEDGLPEHEDGEEKVAIIHPTANKPRQQRPLVAYAKPPIPEPKMTYGEPDKQKCKIDYPKVTFDNYHVIMDSDGSESEDQKSSSDCEEIYSYIPPKQKNYSHASPKTKIYRFEDVKRFKVSEVKNDASVIENVVKNPKVLSTKENRPSYMKSAKMDKTSNHKPIIVNSHRKSVTDNDACHVQGVNLQKMINQLTSSVSFVVNKDTEHENVNRTNMCSKCYKTRQASSSGLNYQSLMSCILHQAYFVQIFASRKLVPSLCYQCEMFSFLLGEASQNKRIECMDCQACYLSTISKLILDEMSGLSDYFQIPNMKETLHKYDKMTQDMKEVIRKLPQPFVSKSHEIDNEAQQYLKCELAKYYASVEGNAIDAGLWEMLCISLLGKTSSLEQCLKFLVIDTFIRNVNYFLRIMTEVDGMLASETFMASLYSVNAPICWSSKCTNYILLALSIALQRPMFIFQSSKDTKRYDPPYSLKTSTFMESKPIMAFLKAEERLFPLLSKQESMDFDIVRMTSRIFNKETHREKIACRACSVIVTSPDYPKFGPADIVCDKCNVIMPCKGILKKHEKNHSRKRCDLCGATFDMLFYSLDGHKHVHRSHQCLACKKTHPKIQCYLCGQQFCNTWQLEVHWLSHPAAFVRQKTWQKKADLLKELKLTTDCLVCGHEGLVGPAHYEKHKVAKCVKCDKTFCDLKSLSCHISELECKCDVCDTILSVFNVKTAKYHTTACADAANEKMVESKSVLCQSGSEPALAVESSINAGHSRKSSESEYLRFLKTLGHAEMPHYARAQYAPTKTYVHKQPRGVKYTRTGLKRGNSHDCIPAFMHNQPDVTSSSLGPDDEPLNLVKREQNITQNMLDFWILEQKQGVEKCHSAILDRVKLEAVDIQDIAPFLSQRVQMEFPSQDFDPIKMESTDQTSQSIKHNPEPKIEHAEPKIEHAEPDIEHSEPKIENADPKIEHAEPKIEKAEPKIEHAEPEIKNAEPEIEHVNQDSIKVEPVGHKSQSISIPLLEKDSNYDKVEPEEQLTLNVDAGKRTEEQLTLNVDAGKRTEPKVEAGITVDNEEKSVDENVLVVDLSEKSENACEGDERVVYSNVCESVSPQPGTSALEHVNSVNTQVVNNVSEESTDSEDEAYINEQLSKLETYEEILNQYQRHLTQVWNECSTESRLGAVKGLTKKVERLCQSILAYYSGGQAHEKDLHITNLCHPAFLKHYTPVKTSDSTIWQTVSVAVSGTEYCDNVMRMMALVTLATNKEYFEGLICGSNKKKWSVEVAKCVFDQLLTDAVMDCNVPEPKYYLMALTIILQRPIYIYRGFVDILNKNFTDEGLQWLFRSKDADADRHTIYRAPPHLQQEGYETSKPLCGFLSQKGFSALMPKSDTSMIFKPFTDPFARVK